MTDVECALDAITNLPAESTMDQIRETLARIAIPEPTGNALAVVLADSNVHRVFRPLPGGFGDGLDWWNVAAGDRCSWTEICLMGVPVIYRIEEKADEEHPDLRAGGYVWRWKSGYHKFGSSPLTSADIELNHGTVTEDL